MKHVLTILVSFFSLSLSAQIYQSRPEYGWNFNRIKISSTFTLPQDTALRSNVTDAGAIVYQISDKSLYTWDGNRWGKITSATSLLALDSAYRSADSIYFNKTTGGRIGVKLNNIPQSGIIGLSDSLNKRWDSSAIKNYTYSKLKTDSLFVKDTVLRGYADLFFDKVRRNVGVTIACEGTSFTYGQQSPGGPVAGINGSGITRAQYQYPSALENTLQYAGMGVSVLNRGYPGDRTTEGLIRWDTCSPVDAVIVEYAVNDAMNYASYPSGIVAVDSFKIKLGRIVERRLKQRSWVLLALPPDIRDSTAQKKVSLYKTAIIEVARKYNLQTIDVQQIIGWIHHQWSDGLHPTDTAYNEWGSQTAAYFLREPESVPNVGHTSTYNAPNKIINEVGNFTYPTATTGYLWQLRTNASHYPLIVNSTADLLLAIKTVNNSTPKTMRIRYGNGIGQKDTLMVNNGFITSPVAYETLLKAPVGKRLFFFVNETGPANYLDEVSFHTQHQNLQQTLLAGNTSNQNITFNDSTFIKWTSFTDYGMIKWRSTGDVDNSSNLNFIVGDNNQTFEGFKWIKDTANNSGIAPKYDTIMSLGDNWSTKKRAVIGGGIDDGATQLQIGGQGSISATAGIRSTNGNVASVLTYDGGGGIGTVGTFSNHPFTIFTNSVERMRILTNGNVGVGATPAYRFEVSDTSTVYYPPIGAAAHPIGPSATVSNTSNTAPAVGAWNKWVVRNATSGLAQVGYLGAVSSLGSFYSPNIVIGVRTGGSTYAERMRIDSAGNIGIGTSAPTSMLHINGSEASSITTVTSNTTLNATHRTVLVNNTAANITITLPAASTCNGRIYDIKKIASGAFTVTVQGNGSENIDAANTNVITAQWDSRTIKSNGTQWFIL